MPTRVVREGILTSEAVNSLSQGAELFYRRLMSVVDDYGRYEAHPAVLLPACYPRQVDKVTVAMVAKWLTECAQAISTEEDDPKPLITLYSVRGKKYLQLNKFGQRTRTDSKCPPPDVHNDGQRDCQDDVHNDGHSVGERADIKTDDAPTLSGHEDGLHVAHARGRTESESESYAKPKAEAKPPLPPTGVLALAVRDELRTSPAVVLAECADLYQRAGLPIAEKHMQLALQKLMSIEPSKLPRIPNYIRWALAMGRWPTPAKTKAFLGLLTDGDWDVDITQRTLPIAPGNTKGEQIQQQAAEIFRRSRKGFTTP